MRRVLTVLVGLALVMSACGDEGSVLAPASSASASSASTSSASTSSASTNGTTSTTDAPAPTGTTPAAQSTTPTTSTTTTTEALAWRPNVSVHQVLVRYDGFTGAGTFEATVCNQQESGEMQPEVVISANGFEAVVGGIVIAPMSCRSFYEPTMDLIGFGVTGPGTVAVTVSAVPDAAPAEGVEITDPVEVPGVTMAAPADQVQTYRDCMASGQGHRNCVATVLFHPIGDVGEVMKVDGRYVAIGPAAYDEVLSYFLADNELCTPRIEAWMGVAAPNPVAHRLVVADDYNGAYTQHFVEIYSVGPEDRWEEANVNVTGWWRDALAGICNNAHEMTHLILGDTPMPSLIEEGLATYIEADARSGSGREPSVECREHTWVGWRFEDGQGEAPYEDLMHWDPNVHGIYYYYTGMCFWDYLANEYGEAKVREIIAATVAHRDPGYNGCGGLVGSVLFMRDIVTPILGEDISEITEDRWGFGSSYTSCEGL